MLAQVGRIRHLGLGYFLQGEQAMNASDAMMQLFRGAVYANFTDPGPSRMSPQHAIAERASLFRDWQQHTISNQSSQKLLPEFVRHWVAADVTAFRNLSSDQEQSATKSINKNLSASRDYADILHSIDAKLYERINQAPLAEKSPAPQQAADAPAVGPMEDARGISLPDDAPADLKRRAHDLPVDWTGKISVENARKDSDGTVALYAERKGHVLPMWLTFAGSRDQVKELLAEYAEIAKRWVAPAKQTVNGFTSDLPAHRAQLDPDSSTAAAAPRDKPAGTSPTDSAAVISKVLENATYKARSDGSVLYSINDRAAFVDHGSQILMEPKADEDEESILAAVLLAKEKYHGSFDITGTDEFKRRTIAIMIKHRVEVDLKDPQQLALYRELSLKSANIDGVIADTKTARGTDNDDTATSKPGLPSIPSGVPSPNAAAPAKIPGAGASAVGDSITEPAAGNDMRAAIQKSDSDHVDAILVRMENGLNRNEPPSTVEWQAWAKSDTEALGQITDPKRQQFATLVMAGVAQEKPEYLAALFANDSQTGLLVEKAKAQGQIDREADESRPAKSDSEKPATVAVHDEVAGFHDNGGKKTLVVPVPATEAQQQNGGLPLPNASEGMPLAEFTRQLEVDHIHVSGIQSRLEISRKYVQPMTDDMVKKWVDSDVDGLNQITLDLTQDVAVARITIAKSNPKYDGVLRRDYPELAKQLAKKETEKNAPPEIASIAGQTAQNTNQCQAGSSPSSKNAEAKGIAGSIEKPFDLQPAANLVAVNASEWWHVQYAAVHAWAKNNEELKADLSQLGPEPQAHETFWFDQAGRPCDAPADARARLAAERKAKHAPPLELSLANDSKNQEPKLVLRGVKKLNNDDYDTTVLLFKGNGQYLQGFVKTGNEKHQVLAHLNSRNADPGTGYVKPNFLKLAEVISEGKDTKWREIGFGNAVNRRKDGKPVFFDEVLLSVGNELLRARVGKNVDADLHLQLGFVDDRKPRPKNSIKNSAEDTTPREQTLATKQKAGTTGAKELPRELETQPVPASEADFPSKPARLRTLTRA